MLTTTRLDHDARAAELLDALTRDALGVVVHATTPDAREWLAHQLATGATLRIALELPKGEVRADLVRGDETRWLFRVSTSVGGNA